MPCSKWNNFYLNFNKINNQFWEKIDASASPESFSSEYFLVPVRNPIKYQAAKIKYLAFSW